MQTPGGLREILLALPHPWSEVTTHLLFGPLELLERLAVLIPRLRINLIRYHGLLPFDFAQGTPSAVEAWRRARCGAPVVTFDARMDRVPAQAIDVASTPPADIPQGSGRGRLWADLMRRTLGSTP